MEKGCLPGSLDPQAGDLQGCGLEGKWGPDDRGLCALLLQF